MVRNGSVRVGLLGQTDGLHDSDTVKRSLVGDAPEYEWAGDARIRDILGGLAADLPWDAEIGTLSGGQRRRVDLARLLIGDWDVLGLDEPTNHLDIRAIWWLAEHLKKRWKPGAGALLVVTHDRWFLDEVCLSMWEVHDRRVEPFEGGYSAYIQQRVERQRVAALAEEKRQNALRRELAWLSRGAQARSTKPKFRVEAARALIADVPELRNPIELKRMAMARLGKQVVEMKQVTVRFDGRTVLDGLDWIIGPGDRYGIVGGNGVGKTTLLRTIQGLQAPDSGTVKIGKTVRFAVLSQHLDELMKYRGDRVREVIGRLGRRTMLDGKAMTPAQLLERLEFTRDDLNEPIEDLSGGQKRRLALMLILLDEPNVPSSSTSRATIWTPTCWRAVEGLLDGWPGTLLLVTHDRYLMERVTDHQFALIDGKLRHLPRGIDEYLELASAAAAGDEAAGGAGRRGQGAQTGGAGSTADAMARTTDPSGDAAGEKRLTGGEIRALRKTMASNERKIETLKGKLEATRAEMAAADPSDFVALGDFQKQLEDLQAQIDTLEEEWLEAAEALGE